MTISKGLLIKGLGACTACVGGIVAITQKDNIASLFSSGSTKIKGAGLECGEGGVCTLKTKLLVKRDSGFFEVTDLGGGVIRLHRGEGNEESFRFSIENGDINGTTDGNKLEEFETYEIVYGGEEESVEDLKGKYYFSRKTDSKTEIKKALGLPNENCDLPANGASVECTISSSNVGTIKFNGGTATISGNVTLTISPVAQKDEYPLGYKFTFKNAGESDVTLKYGDKTINLKKDSPVDFKIKKEGTSLSLERAWTMENLAEKVGLVKGEGEHWTIGEGGLNIKQDTNKEAERKGAQNQDGRIKIYGEQEGYNEGFKFVVEKGDMDLESKSGSTVNILGQFETYEAKMEDDGKWYLVRKSKNEGKIKGLLGLPCELPKETNNSVNCEINSGNIGQIKFEGGTATLTGSPKLTISGGNSRKDYPFGYKFLFSSDSETGITIGSTKTTFKKDLGIEFKIKRKEGEGLSLEKAWTLDSLMELVNFKKKEGEDWWTVGEEGVRVLQGGNKSSNSKAKNTNNAKIRGYGGTAGYNQGFIFVIEEGSIDMDEKGNIEKLDKYETYQVSVYDTDKQWYFTKKMSLPYSIMDILGISKTTNECTMPTSSGSPANCTLNANELDEIKFYGKGGGKTTISTGGSSITLKISKETNEKDFPLGYKFTFSPGHDFTIPKSEGDITVKKGTNTEFKIKEKGGGSTLERAWDAAGLGKKLGLNCSNGSCNFGANISVYESNDSYVKDASITNGSGKSLKYEENQENHNQGIKFYVDGGEDISISGGNGSGSVTTINKKNGGTTYEIAQKTVEGTSKWYLVKKS